MGSLLKLNISRPYIKPPSFISRTPVRGSVLNAKANGERWTQTKGLKFDDVSLVDLGVSVLPSPNLPSTGW